MIDLHIHTIHSDGKETVSCINDLANKNNISILSITDHDSIEAIKEIEKIQDGSKIWIPGVEISTENYYFKDKLKAHLLGYGFDYNNQVINERLSLLYESRACDNYYYIRDLIKKFPFLSYELFDNFKLGKYGLIKKMISNHIKDKINPEDLEILTKYMENNRPNYREYNIKIEEAIELIKKAGGYPVIAHPFKLDVSRERQRELIEYLKECGLVGIEAYNKDASPEEKEYFHNLSEELEMYETGGTDFHRLTKENTPGCDPNDINEKSEFVKKLVRERKTIGDYYARKQ